MKTSRKKPCCGCFGGLFREKKQRPVMVEGFAQTDSPVGLTSRVAPVNDFKAYSDNHFFPRVKTPDATSVQRFRSMIVVRNNANSMFLNESKDESVHTPVGHNFRTEDEQGDNPVPLVFEKIGNKVNSKGMPQLAPVTPARPFRVRSQVVKNIGRNNEII